MSNYTKNEQKIEELVKETISLIPQDRHLLIQKLFFSLINHDKKILIPMLHQAGVSVKEIATALQVDESLIYKSYLKKEVK